MIVTVNKSEFAIRLEELLSLAEQGNDVVVEGSNAIQLKRSKVTVPKPQRLLGLPEGAMIPSKDFDAPLSEEFWLGVEQ